MVMMLLMLFTGLDCVKRKRHHPPCLKKGKSIGGYTIFWKFHVLWMPIMFLLWLHGPVFWIFNHWPLALMILEKSLHKLRKKDPVQVIEVQQLEADVMHIKMRLQSGKKFKYAAGQYLRLLCPDIDANEWHPFTITSAPEQDFFSCHIRCRRGMDWTSKLKEMLNPQGMKMVKHYSSNSLKKDKDGRMPHSPMSNYNNPMHKANRGVEGKDAGGAGKGRSDTALSTSSQRMGAKTKSFTADDDEVSQALEQKSDAAETWQENNDPKTGRKYWYNLKTQTSQWEEPSELRSRKAGGGGGGGAAVGPKTGGPGVSVDINNWQPELIVDGPYGSSSEEVFGYKTVILVGAGIGVTPFASIMRSIVLKHKYKQALRSGGRSDPDAAPEDLRVHFFWACRDRREFDSFKGLLKDDIRSESALKDNFFFNLYMSGETEVTDKKVQQSLDEYARWTKLFTGRPNWNRIFKAIRKDAKPGEHVGVFMCGPPAIAKQLRDASRRHSDKIRSGIIKRHREGVKDGIFFDFHKEVG